MSERIKTGGRQKGSVNRMTFTARKILFDCMQEEIEALPKYLKEIDDPILKVQLITRLLPFILPKIDSMAATGIDNFTNDSFNII